MRESASPRDDRPVLSMHTPGPWFASGGSVFPADTSSLTPRGAVPDMIRKSGFMFVVAKVAEVHAPERWRDGDAAAVLEANARLIASAPDLLGLAKEYERWEGDVILNADWRGPTPRLTQAQWDRLLELQALRNAAVAKATREPDTRGEAPPITDRR